MSAAAVPLNSGSSTLYDFSTGSSQYYGSEAKELETGVFGMYTADVTSDGIISLAAELTQIRTDNLQSGYFSSDVNLDGVVSLAAELTMVRFNNLRASNVP
jgi:hypothetical protein